MILYFFHSMMKIILVAVHVILINFLDFVDTQTITQDFRYRHLLFHYKEFHSILLLLKVLKLYYL